MRTLQRVGHGLKRALLQIRGPIIAPCVILVVFVIMAVFGIFIAPHDAESGIVPDRYKPPFWMPGGEAKYVLGTDTYGRDVLSRLIVGARISLIVGVLAVLVASSIGTTLGILSGYLGGWVDQIIMRITDTWLGLPFLVLAIFMAALTGPGIRNIIIILGVVMWTYYARVVRGEVLSLKERDFVRLAQVAGCGKLRIMVKHILPNVINTVMVLQTLMLGSTIIAEASLSFLGIGVPPPKPAWGLMLAESMPTMMAGKWWLTVGPGVCIVLVVLSVNLLGDWLRVRLDPHLRHL